MLWHTNVFIYLCKLLGRHNELLRSFLTQLPVAFFWLIFKILFWIMSVPRKLMCCHHIKLWFSSDHILYVNQEYRLYQEKSLFCMHLLRVKKQFNLYLEMQNKTSQKNSWFCVLQGWPPLCWTETNSYFNVGPFWSTGTNLPIMRSDAALIYANYLSVNYMFS